MRTNYVLDTSVLIYDPSVFRQFPHNDVLIPIAVLNELDRLKKLPNEAGKHARVAIKLIDEISNIGDISTGILLDNDTLLKVDATYIDLSQPAYAGLGDPDYGDTQILACAQANWHAHPEHDVILVSNDINLRIKAKARGIDAQAHNGKGFALSDLYSGMRVSTNEDAGIELQKTGYIDPAVYGLQLEPHECILFNTVEGAGIAMGRKVSADKIKLVKKVYPWNVSARNAEQSFAIDLMMDKEIDLVTMIGRSGTGKAQPLDAVILTPNGWLKMGDVKVGDIVSVPDGGTSHVMGVFPQGEKDIFRVVFSDGTSTECCEDHLWETKIVTERRHNLPAQIRSTKDISNSLVFGGDRRKNHSIAITEPIQMPAKQHVLDPYSFGCLLGDGTFRYHLSFSSNDNYIVQRLKSALNNVGMDLAYNSQYDYRIIGMDRIKTQKEVHALSGTTIIKVYDNIREVLSDGYSINVVYKTIEKDKTAYGITWKYGAYKTNSALLNYLRENNLWMKKSEEKYIPNDYKYSSIEDRVAILQGLMDTDGSVSKDGKYFEYTTVSNKLAQDVKWLVQSLGGTVTISERKTHYTYKGEVRIGQLSYKIVLSLPNSINPFRLPRKANRVVDRIQYHPRRFIADIKYVGKKQAQCILIDNPHHLYLTNDCIVTHNTLVTLASCLELVLAKKEYEKLIVYRPLRNVGEGIGFLPGTEQEKLAPWFQAIMDNFEALFANKNGGDWRRDLEMYQKKGKIELDSITFIRGRSISNSIILVDEAQNISKEEIKTILTRAGEGSKIILNGDIEQIDARDLDAVNNGLIYAVEKFKSSELAGHITFTKGERSRLATLASEIL